MASKFILRILLKPILYTLTDKKVFAELTELNKLQTMSGIYLFMSREPLKKQRSAPFLCSERLKKFPKKNTEILIFF